MEITFEAELNDGGNRRLSQQQLDAFYNKMKQCVVVVRLKSKKTDDDGHRSTIIKYCNGFFANNKGEIFMCERNIKKDAQIKFRFHNEPKFWRKAKVVDRNGRKDLAVLKPKKICNFYFVKWARQVFVGMEVITISHVNEQLLYSCTVGQVGYPYNPSAVTSSDVDPIRSTPPNRILGHVLSLASEELNNSVKGQFDNDNGFDFLYSLSPDLELIQINNLHAGHGIDCVGAPIFNNAGLAIGLYFFGARGWAYCLPLLSIEEVDKPKKRHAEEGTSQKRKGRRR